MPTKIAETEVMDFASGLDEENAEAVLDTVDGGLSLGPVRIECDVNAAAKTIRVSVSVLGHRISSATLSPSKLSIPIKGNVGLAKVEGAITADFEQTLIRYELKACVRKLIGSWACRKYAGVLVNW